METNDILYLTLSVSIALITIFLSITLVYLMFILRDVSKAINEVKAIVDKINNYIAKPILITKTILEFIKPYIINAEEKITSKRK